MRGEKFVGVRLHIPHLVTGGSTGGGLRNTEGQQETHSWQIGERTRDAFLGASLEYVEAQQVQLRGGEREAPSFV